MTHPLTGELVSSYRKLMNDPATAETWKTAFGKDFGGMAQGDNKTGQTGTNSMFVMSHKDITTIPTDRVVTYAKVLSTTDRKKKTRIEFASLRGETLSLTRVNFTLERPT